MRLVVLTVILVSALALAGCGPKAVRNCCAKTPTVDSSDSASSQ